MVTIADFDKFNLGCGPNLSPGYLNIDVAPTLVPNRIYKFEKAGQQPTFLLNYDLRGGLPGTDGSLSVLYHCHFLEHLTQGQAYGLLQQAFRRLKPSGIMRLLVPDLELWVRHYAAGATEFFDLYRKLILNDDRRRFPTKGSVFAAMMTGFGHKWTYDFESLGTILADIGFTEICRRGFRDSILPDIDVIEPHTELRALESLCIDCIRP